MFRYIPLALLGLGAGCSAYCLAAGQTKLTVEFWGPSFTGCDSARNRFTGSGSYIVGGMYDIVVDLLPDGKLPFQVEYTGISDWTWPGGLEINIGRSSSPGGPFQPSAALQERLQLEYYVTETQALEDSLWRTLGQKPTLPAPQYHFAFRVPSELAGSYLCVNAEWNHPQYGYLMAEKPRCIKITAPCSEEAQHEAWTSQVYTAKERKDYDWAIALADSFVTMGWHEIRGLLDASVAAKRLGRYDEAIQFLDICFERNHTLNIMAKKPLPSVPTEEARRWYHQDRERLMELKNQQERQEQQR